MPVSDYRLRLHIEGVRPAEEEFDRIIERARDARPILRVIQRLMQASAAEQFLSEGSESGNPWEPDSPETVDRKTKEGFDTRTEVRTGALERSLLGSSSETIRRITPWTVTYGTRNFEAQFQGRKRTLLMMTTKDARDWSERFATWLMTGHAGV